MKSTLNEVETQRRFGYSGIGYAPRSHKRVMANCDTCRDLREIPTMNLSKPCYRCGINNPNNKRTKVRIETAGIRYGRLTVVRYVGVTKGRAQRYECVCACGKSGVYTLAKLRFGHTQSCGCIRSERTIAWGKSRGLAEGEAAGRNLLRLYRRGAAGRNVIWLLTDAEFYSFTKQRCYYCGLEPLQAHKGNTHKSPYIYNGIDRLDSSLPYVATNCVAACKHCNYAKRSMSVQEFLMFINRIYHHSIAMRKTA